MTRDELVERLNEAIDRWARDCLNTYTEHECPVLAHEVLAIIRPAVLEEVSADLSAAADEVERATTMVTQNQAIAWALRSASLRYLAMAKEKP